MSGVFDFFKSRKQKLKDELKKLRQEIESDKYGKRNWIENARRYQTVIKTDAELEKEWRDAHSFINLDEFGNDKEKSERIFELQNQISIIEQEEKEENDEEQETNDAWRKVRYQGLQSGGKSGKRKNKKNTKTTKNKNKSRRRFKKRMQ